MALNEKRKYPRLLLTIKDGFFGNFKLSENENIAAPIMNLSAGGLNMAVASISKDKIQAGQQLLLMSIIGAASLKFLNDIQSKISWIKFSDNTRYIYVGCEFIDLREQERQQIIKFVNSERITRGQYD
ncbi:MAG: PilZ domain-containing protein [Desulfobacteraceae bacterium]|nr:PilZ domain-containing protein [Desulfobacteraceae bacterium]